MRKKNIFVLVNGIQWGIYLNLINVEFTSNNLPLMAKGLILELAPPHVQSAWGLGGKGFELRG